MEYGGFHTGDTAGDGNGMTPPGTVKGPHFFIRWVKWPIDGPFTQRLGKWAILPNQILSEHDITPESYQVHV